MAITKDVTSTTLQHIIADETEALKRRHAFLDYADRFDGIIRDQAGARIDLSVSVRDHSDITYHQNGFEATNDAVNSVSEVASFSWGFWSAPVSISAMEAMTNQGDLAIIDILDSRTRNAMGKMGRDLNAQILADAKGISASGVLSLYGETSGVTTGFLEGKAKASQGNSVGGLSKATYNVPGWTNAWASASGAFATNGLDAMGSIYTQISSVHVGDRPVHCIIASEASYKLYKKSLQANERYVSADKMLDGGRMDLAYAGALMAPDLALTQAAWSSDDIFSMYFINFDGVKLYFLPKGEFELVDTGLATGSVVRTFRINLGCQLVGKHLGSLGVLTNANA